MNIPHIDLRGSPLFVDAGDRQIRILANMTDPTIVVLEGFLDDTECEALILAAKPRLKRSTTVNNENGDATIHQDRTSNGMFFVRGENDLIKRIETRISKLVHWPIDRGEGIQVLQYTKNTEYKPHYDFFDPLAPGVEKILNRGGQRIGTLIMYLSDPTNGGSTIFPKANVEISPKRGNAVFFSYPDPVPLSLTLHGGAPVLEGEKWIATKWLRQGMFTDGVQQTTQVAKNTETGSLDSVHNSDTFKTDSAFQSKILPWIGDTIR